MKSLQNEIKKIGDYLSRKQKEFDSVTDLTREVIRNSAQAITLMHADDRAAAKAALSGAYGGAKKLGEFGAKFDYYARQALQEYAEARIFFEIKGSGTIPSPSEVGVGPEAYLLGLMDVMGELKREILEDLRKGKAKSAEAHLDKMRSIYDTTRSLRFAEAVMAGFRRKQDTARIQLENAGSEILSFKSRSK